MKRPTPLKLAVITSGRPQRDIAVEVGLHEATFSRIVNGLHADYATREKIAAALGRDVSDLWPSSQMGEAA